MTKILSVNAGSSSLKFSLYEMPEQNELVNVYVEKIGSKDCFWTLKMNGEKIKKSAGENTLYMSLDDIFTCMRYNIPYDVFIQWYDEQMGKKKKDINLKNWYKLYLDSNDIQND